MISKLKLVVWMLALTMTQGVMSRSVHAEAARPAVFKVVTMNIWGVPWPFSKDPSRFSDIAWALNALDVDVILMQEGFTPDARRATYVNNNRYFVRGPGFFGKLAGSGLYILSRWPIVFAESRAFSNCAGSDCMSKKGSVIATVQRSTDGLRVDVMDTHLNAEGSSSVREAQMDTLALTIDTFRKHNTQFRGNPLIIGGDFNSVQDGHEYAYMMRKLPGLSDTYRDWAESAEGSTYPDDVRAGYTSDAELNSWKKLAGDSGRTRLDYLWLQNPAQGTQLRVKHSRLVLNERVNGRHLSDHFGIETTFEVLDRTQP